MLSKAIEKSTQSSTNATDSSGFVKALNSLLLNPELSDQALRLYLIMCNYGRNGDCYPSQERLAKDTGKHPRTVQRIQEQLYDLGLVNNLGRIVDERSGHLRHSNTYALSNTYGFALADSSPTTPPAALTPANVLEVSQHTSSQLQKAKKPQLDKNVVSDTAKMPYKVESFKEIQNTVCENLGYENLGNSNQAYTPNPKPQTPPVAIEAIQGLNSDLSQSLQAAAPPRAVELQLGKEASRRDSGYDVAAVDRIAARLKALNDQAQAPIQPPVSTAAASVTATPVSAEETEQTFTTLPLVTASLISDQNQEAANSASYSCSPQVQPVQPQTQAAPQKQELTPLMLEIAALYQAQGVFEREAELIAQQKPDLKYANALIASSEATWVKDRPGLIVYFGLRGLLPSRKEAEAAKNPGRRSARRTKKAAHNSQPINPDDYAPGGKYEYLNAQADAINDSDTPDSTLADTQIELEQAAPIAIQQAEQQSAEPAQPQELPQAQSDDPTAPPIAPEARTIIRQLDRQACSWLRSATLEGQKLTISFRANQQFDTSTWLTTLRLHGIYQLEVVESSSQPG